MELDNIKGSDANDMAKLPKHTQSRRKPREKIIRKTRRMREARRIAKNILYFFHS